MKKIFISTVLITSIALFGCSHAPGGKINTELTLKAEIEYNGLSASADVKRDPSQMEIDYTAPESIKELSYIFKEDQVNIVCGGTVSKITDRNDIEDSIADIIYASLEDAIPKSGGSEIKGITTNGAYTLTLDENSNPKKLTVAEKHFVCDFKKSNS